MVTGGGPSHAGAFESDLRKVAAGFFDRAHGERQACIQIIIVLHPVGMGFDVVARNLHVDTFLCWPTLKRYRPTLTPNHGPHFTSENSQKTVVKEAVLSAAPRHSSLAASPSRPL